MRRARLDPAEIGALTAAVAALVVGVSGLRGADYPAQWHRAHVFDEVGFTVWNTGWYGGHSTLGYGLLAPMLNAWVGSFTLGVIAAVAASWLLGGLLGRASETVAPNGSADAAANAGSRWGGPAHWAAAWFGASMAVNLVVGRITFLAGLAVGLAAVWAWAARRAWLAGALAAVTALVSPVVGAFVCTVAGGAALAALVARPPDRRRLTEAITVGAGAAAPLLVVAWLFPSAGWFPYRGGHLAMTLLACAAVFLWSERRDVRLAATLAGLGALVLFVVPNPLAGNFQRFPMAVAAPLVIAGARQVVPVGRLLAVGAVTVWTVLPGIDAARDASRDPSVDAAFHAPLIAEIRAAEGPVGFVEIPFTVGHYEAHHVGGSIPLARGWERQVDLDRNEVLYDPDLDAEGYRAWLLMHGVRWVALPDVALDHGGRPEAAVIATEPAWLERRWGNGDWVLYEVADAVPIVDLPAALDQLEFDRVVVSAPAAGSYVVRLSATPYWEVIGPGCAVENDAGDIVLRFAESGRVELRATLTAGVGERRLDTCG